MIDAENAVTSLWERFVIATAATGMVAYSIVDNDNESDLGISALPHDSRPCD